ncbi:RNA polymerase sigma factor [Luteitalea sp. TBR-22]|nr:RNA polymerase sigma factor [Luteitalea sp. TBR-22]
MAAGDVNAFEALVGRYERVLFSVAYRMLHDRDAAQDATQTAFIRAYEKLATYDRQHRFFSWIYRILVNECLTQKRRPRPDALDAVPPVSRDPGSALDEARRRDALRKAIAELTPEHRDVVLLRHFGELSYDEVAATLGIPVVTVKSRLYAARQRLADKLAALKVAQAG